MKPLRGPKLHAVRRLQRQWDYVILALELIDARRRWHPKTQRLRKVFDTISDNAANAGVILGGSSDLEPDELDLRAGSPP